MPHSNRAIYGHEGARWAELPGSTLCCGGCSRDWTIGQRRYGGNQSAANRPGRSESKVIDRKRRVRRACLSDFAFKYKSCICIYVCM